MDRQAIIDEERRKYYREYMRNYRRNNPEKIKEHTDRYWARRAALEVRSIKKLEAEIQELKYRAYVEA